MSTTFDSSIISAINRIDSSLLRQEGINKAYFMVINELLKNNAASNALIERLMAECEGKVDPDKLAEMKEISEKFLTHDVARHSKMTEAMLDAMQGDSKELERKLNELFRPKTS